MADEPEKVELNSPDLAAERLAALEELLPGVYADDVLDADRLAKLTGAEVTGLKDGAERYGLMWAGKHEAVRSLLRPSRGTLIPDVENSIDFDTAENVFIEGDNLEVLKLLQKAYNDQVKLIYIDPPYNTGKEFVYEDDFQDGLRGYLEFTGQLDEEGQRTSASVDTAGRRHSRWLSMMYPRLAQARNLLRQDGVLLCSINDRELHNVRHLFDQIFGPENFVANFIWTNDGNIEQQSSIKVNHEYIVCYARSIVNLKRPTVIDPNIDEGSKLFNKEIENSITKNGPKNPPSTVVLPAGFPASTEAFSLDPRDDKWPHLLDKVEVEDGKVSAPARLRSGWSSRRLLDLFIENRFQPIEDGEGKETRFAITKTGAIYGYKRRSEQQGHVLTVLRNLGTTKATSSWLERELGLSFDFPKPERLIQYLVAIFSDSADLVLDFFAGSGTTAHAVALQNVVDGGRRRCLSVNISEPTPQDSAAAAAGYETIADMTWARIRDVVDSIEGAKTQGLKTFSLGDSNFLSPAIELDADQLDLEARTIREDGDITDHCLAGEILLKEAVRLDATWNRTTVAGSDVITADDVSVVLSREVTGAIVEQAITLEPRVLVFLEDGFAGRDAEKANAFYACQQAGITMKTV